LPVLSGASYRGHAARRRTYPQALCHSARCRESRPASATGRPQPESSPAATASARSILQGASRDSGRRRPKKSGGDPVKLCKINACLNLRNQASINSEPSCSGSVRSFGDASSSEAIQPSLIYTTPYSATRGRNSDCDPRIPRDHLAFCRKYPTETCVAGNGGV
jgi:hypothetical protein